MRVPVCSLTRFGLPREVRLDGVSPHRQFDLDLIPGPGQFARIGLGVYGIKAEGTEATAIGSCSAFMGPGFIRELTAWPAVMAGTADQEKCAIRCDRPGTPFDPFPSNLAGRSDHRWSCPSVDAGWLSYGRRSSWQRKSAASSFGTARNRRTRTRMSGGVGGGGEIPPPTRLCA